MIENFGIKQQNEDGTFFTRIGLEPTHAKMFGVKDTDEIYRLTFDIHEDQSEPDWNAIDYWGWLDFNDMEYKMIFPNYKLFHACFPYGVKASEASGRGKSYRLKLVSADLIENI
jgi:hypothetical protein